MVERVLVMILKAKTFSASVRALIKSNARREVTLGFIDAIHLGEEPGSTGIGLLQTGTSSISGTQRLCISL
jgi:hypothetical protein